VKVLQSDRLFLRTVSIDDASFYVHLVNQPSFKQFIGDKGVYTEEQARKVLSGGIIEQQERLGYSMYMVQRKSDMAPLGMCGLIKRDAFDDVDIGCAFLPQYWGLDYPFEAGAAVMEHAHDVIDLQRIIALVAPGNRSSVHLVGRLGFRLEREAELLGKPVNLYAYCFGDVRPVVGVA
jgi:RimJ/RimL family protein N-acetyltransferase